MHKLQTIQYTLHIVNDTFERTTVKLQTIHYTIHKLNHIKQIINYKIQTAICHIQITKHAIQPAKRYNTTYTL